MLNDKTMIMKNLKLTNQEILLIKENSFNIENELDRTKYDAVKFVEARAEVATNNIVKRTIFYWTNKDYQVFCNQVKFMTGAN